MSAIYYKVGMMHHAVTQVCALATRGPGYDGRPGYGHMLEFFIPDYHGNPGYWMGHHIYL